MPGLTDRGSGQEYSQREAGALLLPGRGPGAAPWWVWGRRRRAGLGLQQVLLRFATLYLFLQAGDALSAATGEGLHKSCAWGQPGFASWPRRDTRDPKSGTKTGPGSRARVLMPPDEPGNLLRTSIFWLEAGAPSQPAASAPAAARGLFFIATSPRPQPRYPHF